MTNGTLKDRMGPGMGAISRKIKWAQKILPVQLDPMPRGIGIEEKQKELFAAI